jgi:CRP/FNR family cyclic AMP-dependent transcriptional regulator
MSMNTKDTKPAGSNPMWANLFRKRPPWKQTAIRLLQETPIFEGIPQRVIAQLVDTMHRRVYRDQEAVFRRGDQGLGMYLVLSGQVSILLENTEMARLLPGDFFGEVALFGEQQRTADAFASGDTELVGFFRPDLQEWVERSPKQGSRVLTQLGKVLAERLRVSNERLSDQLL